MNMQQNNRIFYPSPAIPLAPVLSEKSIKLSPKSREVNSILSNSEQIHVTSGRAGIALALEHAGITEKDEVLIPAYHCESMISPVLWRAATPVFYQINADTSINDDDIQSKITSSTKAVIVTHYFGHIQDLCKVKELCDKNSIVLIEDCAHAFFGSKDGIPVGTVGDYSIASSMKFFPCFDGGVLASSKHSLNTITLESQPTSLQLKSFFNIVERAINYGRFGFLGKFLKAILKVKELTWNSIKRLRKSSVSTAISPSSSEGGYGLDQNWIHKNTSTPSLMTIKKSDYKRITSKRRANYEKLYTALVGLENAHPLFDALDKECVPLVFPLFVNSPEQTFDTLKRQGVPIWRFGEFLDEEINQELCPNSMTLSAHVFQFPCHQELTSKELDWMIEKIIHAIK
jgi:dTDP-4-amino-4,6-dideoxygalactose transaminase